MPTYQRSYRLTYGLWGDIEPVLTSFIPYQPTSKTKFLLLNKFNVINCILLVPWSKTESLIGRLEMVSLYRLRDEKSSLFY